MEFSRPLPILNLFFPISPLGYPTILKKIYIDILLGNSFVISDASARSRAARSRGLVVVIIKRLVLSLFTMSFDAGIVVSAITCVRVRSPAIRVHSFVVPLEWHLDWLGFLRSASPSLWRTAPYLLSALPLQPVALVCPPISFQLRKFRL